MSKTELKTWKLPSWYLGGYCALVIGVFCLLALGSSVRIMKAGLACPDWPLCFGDVIPDFHPQVYFEFIHRVVAGGVTIVTLALQFLLFRSRAERRLKFFGGLSLVILAAQIVFGGLTVLLLLEAGVVATHLLMGTAFFITLLWIYLSLKSTGERAAPAARSLTVWSGFLSLAIYGQMLLGGLVASNFASLVCIDFPTCFGQWIPTLHGIIGLQVIHRLGAYTIFTLVTLNWFLVRRMSQDARVRKISNYMFLCVCCQVALGISNVVFLMPPIIAVGHLAMAVLLLSVAVRQLHASRWVYPDLLTSSRADLAGAPAPAFT